VLLLLLLLLLLFAQHSKQYVEAMSPEAVVHAGYALARNGHLPSNSWRKAYLRALQVRLKRAFEGGMCDPWCDLYGVREGLSANVCCFFAGTRSLV
jgi:hypothetical protein